MTGTTERRRKRPDADPDETLDKPVVAEGDAQEVSAYEPTPPKRRKRRRRKAPGERRKLHVNDDILDPDFEYRWVNDVPGRIQDMTIEDDWDHVQEPQAKRDAGDGEIIRRLVGANRDGSAMYAYLLRKPKEFYNEDKSAEWAQIDRKEDDIKHGRTAPGVGDNSQQYVPDRGIRFQNETA